MGIHYLFSSQGDFIAYRVQQYVFNTQNSWIGWIPWNDGEIVNVDGEYIGTICDNNRLYYFTRREFKMHPGYPSFPGHMGNPGYPSYPGCASIPPFARDIILHPDEKDRLFF